jgi:ABC-2 type transport system permease protein
LTTTYFRPVIAVMLRYFYLLRGTPARWMPIFAWVAIDIVLWGFITKYLNSVTSSGLNFVPTLLGAVLLFDFFTRVMHGVAGVFLEDVWSRSFLNLFASPLTIPQYLLGLVVTSTVTSLIGLMVMLVLATSVFGLSFFAYGLTLVPFLLILFLFGVSLGICTSAVVLRLGPSAEWLVWPVPAVVSPFAGVFYPISILPQWMQSIGKLLPVSYVFEGLRTIISGGTVPVTSLFLGGGLAVIYVLLACWFFKHVFRHAVRTGILARYSAESLS